MKRTLIILSLFLILKNSYAESSTLCINWPTWFKGFCLRLNQTWTQGNNEIYFSGYAWHNRYTYIPEKIKTYNETAWGGGLGKGYYDEYNNWHGLSAIAFLDSHKNLEPAVGYSYLKMFHFTDHARFGIGYTLLITARRDILNYVPIPGILPWATLSYRSLALSATYIPGSIGTGNVLFVVGKWTFSKL